MSRTLFKNIDSAPTDNLDLTIDSLKIDERLTNILREEFKFDKLTPVQAATIPLILKNKDVIVEAKTGSGKTLSFIVPLLDNIIKMDAVPTSSITPFDVLAIVLSPTRELATQIYDELCMFTRKHSLLKDDKPLKCQLINGGKRQENDLMKYNKYGANIIVATPGRLSEMLERQGDNKLAESVRKNVMYLILDEADHLLAVGFERSISGIFSYLPKQRRTSLFSATQTDQVEQLIKSGLRNPIKVNMNSNDSDYGCIARPLSMPDKLINYYQLCDNYLQKIASVLCLIKSEKHKKIVIFFSTCCQVDYFECCFKNELVKFKIPILKLHRKLKNKRKAIFAKLKSQKRYVFLVTDILCRGIDIPDLSCVVHMDLPANPEAYVHRSGRSGHKLNMSGMSLIMAQRSEYEFIEYCRRKQINLKPFKQDEKTCESIKTLALELEAKIKSNESETGAMGKQAFVSYIRFYTSKLCLRQLLFPKLDIESLVRSFGLKEAPKMPELKNNRKNN